MNTFKVYYWRPIDRRTLRLRRSCQKPIGTPLVSIGQHNVQVVILETSHNTICVRIDLDGSLKAPSFVCSENNQKNLVGSQSDEALTAGQDLIISSRSRIGYRQRRCGESLFFSPVRPFLMRSSTRKHDLFIILDLRSTQVGSLVQLSTFPGLPSSSCEYICQMLFERFNVSGFSILERPMAQSYRRFHLREPPLTRRTKPGVSRSRNSSLSLGFNQTACPRPTSLDI